MSMTINLNSKLPEYVSRHIFLFHKTELGTINKARTLNIFVQIITITLKLSLNRYDDKKIFLPEKICET